MPGSVHGSVHGGGSVHGSNHSNPKSHYEGYTPQDVSHHLPSQGNFSRQHSYSDRERNQEHPSDYHGGGYQQQHSHHQDDGIYHDERDRG